MGKFLTLIIIVALVVFGIYYFLDTAELDAPEERTQTTQEEKSVMEEKMEKKEKDDDAMMMEEKEDEEAEEETEEKAVEEPEESDGLELFSSDIEVNVDDTWLSFTSFNESYSFRYPTRGTHAPTWESFFLDASDDKIKDGCYLKDHMNPNNRLGFETANGTVACHTWAVLPDDSTTIREDFVLIPVENHYLLLAFEIDTARAQFDHETYLATLAEATKTVELN